MCEEGALETGWHLLRGGERHGPISHRELLRLAEIGKLREDDLLWRPGFETWREARAVPGLLTPPDPELMASVADTPPAVQTEPPAEPASVPEAPVGQSPVPKKPDRFEGLRRLWHGEQPLERAWGVRCSLLVHPVNLHLLACQRCCRCGWNYG